MITAMPKKRGRKPYLLAGKHRQPIFGRVEPETLEFLRDLGGENQGRNIDKAVQILRELKIHPSQPTLRAS